MMQKVVRKLFLAWHEEEERKFLEEMALKGYRLIKVKVGKYTFEKTEPKKLVYQFDFKGIEKIDEQEYLQIYEDAGWVLACEYSGWYYFYKEKTSKELDLSIFNNNESKRAKYRRILFFLLLTGFPLYYLTFIFYPAIGLSGVELPGFYPILNYVLLVVSAIHIFAVVKIALVYRKIQKSIRE